MMLPLPTTTDLDVTAEKLKEVERDRRQGAAGLDIAGAAGAAQQAAANSTAMSEHATEREQAQWFQQNYVDKGWQGAEALWKELGSPGELNPRYARTSPDAAPATWFQMAAKYKDVKKDEAGAEKYAASIEGEDKEAAAAIRSRVVPAGTVFIQRQQTGRADLTAKNRKAISDAEIELKETQKGLDRAVAWARVNKAVPGVNLKNLEKNQEDLTAVEKEIANLKSSGADVLDPGALSDARARRRSLDALVRAALAKIPAGSDTPTGGPKEGDTKTNTKGLRVIYKGGQWTLL